jgi:hypothetical protein
MRRIRSGSCARATSGHAAVTRGVDRLPNLQVPSPRRAAQYEDDRRQGEIMSAKLMNLGTMIVVGVISQFLPPESEAMAAGDWAAASSRIRRRRRSACTGAYSRTAQAA